MKEEFKWLGNTQGHCWECGKPFPTEHLQKEAEELSQEHPGSRRAFSGCPEHNYGDVAIFPGDFQWED